jgi:Dienelactone hydrolase family
MRSLADSSEFAWGLHTGEPTVTEEGYVEIDVHRAARIAAAGHGRQILVSQATRDLTGADRFCRLQLEAPGEDGQPCEQPLLIGGEEPIAPQEFPVPTLPADDAAALFTQRARQLEPRFEPDDHQQAIPLFERAGNESSRSTELQWLGEDYRDRGDCDEGERVLEKTAMRARELGFDQQLATTLHSLGRGSAVSGDRSRSLAHVLVPAVSEFGGAWPDGVSVQVHGKAGDPFFAEDIEAAQALVDSTEEAELFLYPGVEHLFADSSLPAYDATAATLLIERVLSFLDSLQAENRT